MIGSIPFLLSMEFEMVCIPLRTEETEELDLKEGMSCHKPDSESVTGRAPSASPSITSGSGVLTMLQGKEFPETCMGG